MHEQVAAISIYRMNFIRTLNSYAFYESIGVQLLNIRGGACREQSTLQINIPVRHASGQQGYSQ